MRRVLRPGGRLLFVEHGRVPDANVVWWQDRLTAVWKRLGGSCHLNRAIGTMIEGAGFQIDRIETSYMRGPKPMRASAMSEAPITHRSSFSLSIAGGEGIKEYDGDSGSAAEIGRLWQTIEKSVAVINNASKKAAMHRFAA